MLGGRGFPSSGRLLGQTLEVDHKTSLKEIITPGSEVMLGKVHKLPTQIPLQVDNLQISILVEVDQSL